MRGDAPGGHAVMLAHVVRSRHATRSGIDGPLQRPSERDSSRGDRRAFRLRQDYPRPRRREPLQRARFRARRLLPRPARGRRIRDQRRYSRSDRRPTRIAHLHTLVAGRAIDQPVYDFATHARTDETRVLEPAPFVFVEGLFALYWSELSALMHPRCSSLSTTRMPAPAHRSRPARTWAHPRRGRDAIRGQGAPDVRALRGADTGPRGLVLDGPLDIYRLVEGLAGALYVSRPATIGFRPREKQKALRRRTLRWCFGKEGCFGRHPCGRGSAFRGKLADHPPPGRKTGESRVRCVRPYGSLVPRGTERCFGARRATRHFDGRAHLASYLGANRLWIIGVNALSDLPIYPPAGEFLADPERGQELMVRSYLGSSQSGSQSVTKPLPDTNTRGTLDGNV